MHSLQRRAVVETTGLGRRGFYRWTTVTASVSIAITMSPVRWVIL
ncbi:MULTISPECIES: hypothetical protein [unclassified Pseudoalteromonas]